MLVQRARSVCWKQWAAKHKLEELKEGAWIDPALVLLRKSEWGEKHRNVARKIFLEGGCTLQRQFDIGWVGYQSMSRLPGGGRHRGAQALPLSGVARSKAGYSRVLRKVGAKGENVEERMEVAKRHPLGESQWNGGHFSVTKWESEKHRSWGMPVEGFEGHAATDGSLSGKIGKWGACGWAVVQLDYDEEMGPLHGMHGSVEAGLEVQRTIKRAELEAFPVPCKKSCWASQGPC